MFSSVSESGREVVVIKSPKSTDRDTNQRVWGLTGRNQFAGRWEQEDFLEEVKLAWAEF